MTAPRCTAPRCCETEEPVSSQGRTGGYAAVPTATESTLGPLGDPLRWQRIRALFPLAPDLRYLDTAAAGSVPRPALELLAAAQPDTSAALRPRDSYPDTLVTEARATLASAYGCSVDELAIVSSATDAFARILHGVELGPGDEVLATDHDCFTVRTPLALLRDRRGVVVRRVCPPVGPEQRAEQIVAMFEAAVTRRTRVIQWPAVSLTIGAVFPNRELAELAQRHGLISVVEGAQFIGQFDVDLRSLGVDFLASSGSKYQCGPMGTGLLYARNRVDPEHNPLPLPDFWPTVSLNYPVDGGLPRRGGAGAGAGAYDLGALLQQSDTADLTRPAVLAAASRLWDQIGRADIARYVVGLGARIRQQIVDRWGTGSLLSPLADPSMHSGIVTFDPFASAAWSSRSAGVGATDAVDSGRLSEFVRRMEDEFDTRLQQVFVPAPGRGGPIPAIRMSPHLYNSADEIDAAVTAMWQTAEKLR
ncbi:aminotransferase class V-fold PLP-dependent enzyme [Micromonospora sp. LOL_021]|uniref:aminotransferase class V-fold PLP-dependent enzyme n=1 Tax=Micromonospora sp. LOL_021 TaxID=3345417 RepID=UPI003A8A5FB0